MLLQWRRMVVVYGLASVLIEEAVMGARLPACLMNLLSQELSDAVL